jgi:hypothetical protein
MKCKQLCTLVVGFLAALVMALPAGALQSPQIYEDQDVKVLSKQGPEYLGYRVYAGSTGTTSVYYKVTAIVTGHGETSAASLTVTEANAVMSSTNALQLVWNSVKGATSYNLYRSTVSASTYFYLITNTAANVRSWVDDDAYSTTEGAAYSASAQAGGNLVVQNNATVGGTLAVTGATTLTGALSVTGVLSAPLLTYTLAEMNAATKTAGTLCYVSDGVSATKVCVSSGTVGGFTLITATSTHCQ